MVGNKLDLFKVTRIIIYLQITKYIQKLLKCPNMGGIELVLRMVNLS
jgi:hypothetical protein